MPITKNDFFQTPAFPTYCEAKNASGAVEPNSKNQGDDDIHILQHTKDYIRTYTSLTFTFFQTVWQSLCTPKAVQFIWTLAICEANSVRRIFSTNVSTWLTQYILYINLDS